MSIPTCYFYLGHDLWALADLNSFPRLNKHKWHPHKVHRSFYAKTSIRKGDKVFYLSMHRYVAATPRGMICHHRNSNTLDNRLINLQNMSKEEHALLHRDNHVLIQFGQKTR